MDTLAKIKEAKIIDIIKVVLGDILLELYFNVEYLNGRCSFKLSISDNGETILFSDNENFVALNDISYEAYTVVKVSNEKDELSKLLGSEILDVQFGIGKTYSNKKVIYYIKINTNKHEFLFFNNGDEGGYSFDKTEAILKNDIYGYVWSFKPPFEQLK